MNSKQNKNDQHSRQRTSNPRPTNEQLRQQGWKIVKKTGGILMPLSKATNLPEKEPDPTSDLFNQAFILMNALHSPDKNEDYLSAFENDPEFAVSNNLNFKSTRNNFSRAIEADEKFTGAYIDRGVSRGKLGNHEEAISDFTEAIRIDGNNANAYHNRTVAWKALNDEAGAKQDFHKAFELQQKFTKKGNASG